MEAGLQRFGTDFGNRERDHLYFQVDREVDAYLAAKRAIRGERHSVLARDEAERAAHRRVLAWMRDTLGSEHRSRFAGALPADYAELSLLVQEDFAVVHRSAPDAESAIAVQVSFPSGWRPERIVGATFRAIHGPVPEFADQEAQARSMVASMIERGPYVRFVWTVTADSHLDHHPEEGRREPWSARGRGFLRVERQVTVPFPDVAASLFLIRTYLYPFESLTDEERRILRSSLETMPPEILRYKGLSGAPRDTALALLA
jgi:hypothetical protein